MAMELPHAAHKQDTFGWLAWLQDWTAQRAETPARTLKAKVKIRRVGSSH